MLWLIVVVILLLVLTTMSILLRFMMLLCLILTLVAALCALLTNLSLNADFIINAGLCSCLLDVLRDNLSGLLLLVVLLDILECLPFLHDGELWSLLILFPLVLAPILLLCFLFLLLIHDLLLLMRRFRLVVIASITPTVVLRVSYLTKAVLGRRVGVVITLILALLLLSILVLLVVLLPAS